MTDERRGENGWGEWKQLVLSELKDLKDGQAKTDDKVNTINETLAGLKVKHGLLATLAGAASGVASALAVKFGGGGQ